MAKTFRMTIQGTPKLRSTLQRLGTEAPQAAASALFLEAEAIMSESRMLVPVDMGPLRASGHVQLPEQSEGRVSVTMGYGGTAAPYAIYMHEGTGPAVGRPAFFPPPSAIEGWVRRNLHPAEDEVKGLTFVVARAIGQRGLKPLKFLERPFNAAKRGASARMAKRMEAWLERYQEGAA